MTETTSLDICDRAFVTDLFGSTAQVLAGETVLVVGFSAILVPEEQKVDEDEAGQRIEAFVRSVAEGIAEARSSPVSRALPGVGGSPEWPSPRTSCCW
jgi:hypothetical protein